MTGIVFVQAPKDILKKAGNKIFSQPIKGTAKRNLENA